MNVCIYVYMYMYMHVYVYICICKYFVGIVPVDLSFIHFQNDCKEISTYEIRISACSLSSSAKM